MSTLSSYQLAVLALVGSDASYAASDVPFQAGGTAENPLLQSYPDNLTAEDEYDFPLVLTNGLDVDPEGRDFHQFFDDQFTAPRLPGELVDIVSFPNWTRIVEVLEPSGLGYSIFRLNGKDEYIVALRGTDGADPKDWKANLNYSVTEWQDAQERFFDRLFDKNNILGFKPAAGTVHFVGQSLGGGLAQYAAYEFGRRLQSTNADLNKGLSYDKTKVTLTTFNAFAGARGLIELEQVAGRPYERNLLAGVQTAHYGTANDIVHRLGSAAGPNGITLGHLNGNTYLIDFRRKGATGAPLPDSDLQGYPSLVEAHRIETGFYRGFDAYATDFHNALRVRREGYDYIDVGSVLPAASFLSRAFSGKDVTGNETEASVRLVLGVAGGLFLGSPAASARLSDELIEASYKSGATGDVGRVGLKALNVGVFLANVAATFASPLVLLGRVFFSFLDLFGVSDASKTKAQEGMNDLFAPSGTPAPVITPDAPATDSAGDKISRLETSMAVAVAFEAPAQIDAIFTSEKQRELARQLTLLDRNKFDADEFSMRLVQSDWARQTMAYLEKARFDSGASESELVQFGATMMAYFAGKAEDIGALDPQFKQTTLAALTEFAGKDFGKAIGNLYEPFNDYADANPEIFGATSRGFTEVERYREALAQSLLDARFSGVREQIQAALGFVDQALATLVVEESVGANPYQAAGFDPALAPLPSVISRERAAQTYTGYLPHGAGPGGQRVHYQLAGASNATFEVVTGADTIQLDDSGTFEIVIPEGQRQASFVLWQNENINANSTLTLSATLVDANGNPTHQTRTEATIALTAVDEGSDTPTTTYTITGDQEGGATDPYGNVVGGTPAPGRNDFLNGSPDNDRIEGLGGDDTVNASLGDDHVLGGEGNDALAGQEGADRIEGEAGRDFILAGAGNDLVLGGAENDSLLAGNEGDDRIYAGTQADEATIFNSDTVTATPGSEWLDGGDGRDRLIGSTYDNVLLGGAGEDLLAGGAGADTLHGDRDVVINPPPPIAIGTPVTLSVGAINLVGGADFLHGGGGNDFLYGEVGADTLLGGGGDDELQGDGATLAESLHGGDFLDGGAGDDQLFGQGGNDALFGGAGNDTLQGDDLDHAPGDDYLSGEDGDDTLLGAGGKDVLYGGAGNDQLFGDADNVPLAQQMADELFGGEGEDSLQGYGGEDYLDGGAGADTALGGLGADRILGGAGNDILAGDEGDSNPDAGEADVIDGGVGDDQLFGQGGDDTLIGGLGADLIQAGVGDDAADGGAGDDVLFGEAGADRLSGGDGDDVLLGEDNSGAPAGGDDLLEGGAGDDVLLGEGGADVLLGGVGADQMAGGAGDDTLDGGEDGDFLEGDSGADVLAGGAGDDQLQGGADNDTLEGGEGDDVLAGGAGDDLLQGGAGRDIYFHARDEGHDRISDTAGNTLRLDFRMFDPVNGAPLFELQLGSLKLNLFGSNSIDIEGFDPDDPLANPVIDTFEFLDGTVTLSQLLANGFTLRGTFGDDVIDGTALEDTIKAFDGADVVIAKAGDDAIELGAGDDIADAGAGNDFVLGQEGNDLIFGGAGHDTILAGAGDDQLFGEDGDDALFGDAGADRLEGGAGEDSYAVDNPLDQVIENPGEGRDSVAADISYTLPANVEKLTLVGATYAQALDGAGNALDNDLTGNDGANVLLGLEGNDFIRGAGGADRLDGGQGADLLRGGDGSDYYLIDDVGDVVTEFDNGPAGTEVAFVLDTVESSVSFSLGAYVEDLVLTGTLDLNGAGNNLDNRIIGNEGANALLGLEGDDVIEGGLGNDFVDGGLGADVVAGGAGDDIYIVDLDDTVIENPGEGRDTAQSDVTYTLGENLEDLVLTGFDPIAGAGNVLDNAIFGNFANNALFGLEGNDTLAGSGGADRLDGGAGADLMRGGLDSDTYVVNDAGDLVAEDGGDFAQGFTDLVESSIDYTLPDFVENLTLTGATFTENLTGTGNELDNAILGNAGNNVLLGLAGNDVLDGGAGADAMTGGAGDDAYSVDSAGDVTAENAAEGHDTVYASVSHALGDNLDDLHLTGATFTEDLSGTGNDLDNLIVGNAGANALGGLAGDDTLDGGAGIDTMAGGAGDDLYIADSEFDQAIEAAGEGVDAVESSASFTLGENVENLRLLGEFVQEPFLPPLAGVGNALDNAIAGSDGDNALSGLAGADALDGRAGNDFISGDEGDDALYGGDDAVRGGDGEGGAATVLAGNSDTLFGGVGNDAIDGGSGDDQLFGDEGDDFIYGGDDGLTAGGGAGGALGALSAFIIIVPPPKGPFLTNDDILDGGLGDDILDGGSGNDALFGAEGADTLWGGGDGPLNLTNDDTLDGGAGIDFMAGGTGDDTYVVDGFFTETTDIPVYDDCGDLIPGAVTRLWTTDTVFENPGEGYDAVYSSADFTLPENVEDLYLQWYSDARIGRGNSGNNAISGNSADNRLEGGAGHDSLFGWFGNDTLEGGAGEDVLDGGAGDDVYLFGPGAGHDSVVNDGGGFDRVHVTGGLSAADVTLSRSGDDVTLGLAGGQDRMVLQGWFGSANPVREIIFCDGAVLDDAAIADLANAHIISAAADGAAASEDGVLTASGNVLTNDSDSVSGETLTVANPGSFTGAYGTLALAADGAYTYMLDNASSAVQGLGEGQSTADVFTYLVEDGAQANASALLSVTIIGQNDAPVAEPDADAVSEDGSPFAFGNVLANDGDIDQGTVLTVANAGAYTGTYGTLTFGADGGYTYSLDNASSAVQSLTEGESVTDVFAYEASDGILSAPSTLTVTIRGVNDAPVAADDAASAAEDALLSVTGNVLANDSDVDAGAVLAVANPGAYAGSYGTLALAADGGYEYLLDNASSVVQSLAAGQSVTDSFAYAASDGMVDTPATLTVTIAGANDAPVAADDAAGVQEDAVLAASGNVLANDSDVDAGAVLAVANPGSYSGAYGTLTLSADGSYDYALDNAAAQSLAQGQVASDRFGYTASDEDPLGALSAEGFLTVSITGANDAPATQVDFAAVREDQTLAARGNVLANDSDVDAGTALRVAAPGAFAGAYGTLVLSPGGGYAYILNNAAVQSLAEGQTVTDAFGYAASDGIVSTPSILTVTVSGANDAPVTVADAASVTEDGVLAASGNVLANDSDADAGSVLTVAAPGIYTGTYGALTLGADGGYTYSLDNASNAVQSLAQGQVVTDVFGYAATDGIAATPSTLTVTIAGANDAPVVVNPLADRAVDGCGAFSFALPQGVFSDIDAGDRLTLSATLADGSALPAWLNFDPATLSFAGDASASGGGAFQVRVSAADSAGASASDVFDLTVSSGQGEEILGTNQADTLVGTPCDDTILGFQGSDELFGRAGNDILLGDEGRDALYGEAGHDILKGGVGRDRLDGGSGNDLLCGGNGKDVLEGGAGANVFIGGRGQDTLTTSGLNDVILLNAHDAGGSEGEDDHEDDNDHEDGGHSRSGSGDDDDEDYADDQGARETVIVTSSSNANRLTFSLGDGLRAQDIRFKREGADLNMDLGSGEAVRIQGWYGLSAGERPSLTLQVIGDDVRRYAPGAAVNALASGKEVKAEKWLGTGILAQDPVSGQPQVIGGAIAWSYAQEGNCDALPAADQRAWLASADFGSPQTVDPAALPPAGNHPDDDVERDDDARDWSDAARAPVDERREAGDVGRENASGKHEEPAKRSEDSDSWLEQRIRAWFEEESLSEQLAPFSELNRREEAWVGQASVGGGRDYRAEWARMDARLNQHLEGTQDGAELGSEFGAGFRPFGQLYSGGGDALQWSADDGRQMQVLTGLKEGLRTL